MQTTTRLLNSRHGHLLLSSRPTVRHRKRVVSPHYRQLHFNFTPTALAGGGSGQTDHGWKWSRRPIKVTVASESWGDSFRLPRLYYSDIWKSQQPRKASSMLGISWHWGLTHRSHFTSVVGKSHFHHPSGAQVTFQAFLACRQASLHRWCAGQLHWLRHGGLLLPPDGWPVTLPDTGNDQASWELAVQSLVRPLSPSLDYHLPPRTAALSGELTQPWASRIRSSPFTRLCS